MAEAALEVPIERLYILLENGWIRKHHFFMCGDTGREITRDQSSNDFFYGNDNYPTGVPSPDFAHHLSPRGLTWENEYVIAFFNRVGIPALVRNGLSERSKRFLEVKSADVVKRGLSKYVNFADLDKAGII